MVTRSALIYLSRQEWLKEFAAKFSPFRRLTTRFIAGETSDEAITAIRDMEEFKQLPIIALTAKAMKADRDHCLAVGASDYISKPLDIDQLVSLLRVWLYRQDESR